MINNMKKRVEQTIPANMKPEYSISISDIDCYVFRGQKVSLNPADMIHPIVWYRIFPIRPIDYERFFSPDLGAEQQIAFMKNMNYTALELIHNPTFPETQKQIERVKADRLAVREADAVLKAKEGKKKAKISDIEKLSK
jgi:hypothetical protein